MVITSKHGRPGFVTTTKAGLSPRDTAIAVIADKLGITTSDVRDDTDLGDMYHEIAMVVCFKTGNIIISSPGMKARDLFKQLH